MRRTQRAELHLQQTLWLKLAREADDNEDARRLKRPFRNPVMATFVGSLATTKPAKLDTVS